MEISKLGVPLLMVKGNFRNLSTLTVEELETFIPFMTGCSLRRGGATLVKGVPEWWLRTIQYKFPLRKPKGLSDMGYRRHLQSLVCKCYCYHDAHFLLSFSSKFSQYPQSIFLRNNADNTTSVFCIESVAEMFTFDNENKEYDSKSKEKPNWRSLMPLQTNKPNQQIIADIYLCENCDVEFYNQLDMQKHEKECYGITIDDDMSDEIQIITHIKPTINPPTDKNGFLDYFGLLSKSHQLQKIYYAPRNDEPEGPAKRWVILNMCLHKNRKVEFSSLLGRKMLDHRIRRDIMTRLEKSMMTVESFCSTENRVDDSREPQRPRITYRNPRKKTWTHSYCFTKKQRMEKMKTFKTDPKPKMTDGRTFLVPQTSLQTSRICFASTSSLQ